MPERTDVSKWVTYPARAAVGTVVGAGIFLLGRSLEVPGSAEFWDLAAQPLATSVAGAGAIAAGLLALHNGAKTRALDGIHHQQTMDRDRETNLRDRYTTAAQQLGDHNGAVREAGVHALAALVDDWFSHGELTGQKEHSHSQARVCAHLLCSYLRANRRTDAGAGDFQADEGAVRSSVVSVFRERIPAWRRVEDDWTTQAAIDEQSKIVIDLSGAILPNADLTKADLRDSILVGTILSQANFAEAHLDGAILRDADLSSANLVFASMSRADLSNANLSEVRAIRTNFGRTLAEGAVFDRAIFLQAGFGAANLRGASFRDADNFVDDHLTGETVYSDKTIWPTGFTPSTAKKLDDGAVWVRR